MIAQIDVWPIVIGAASVLIPVLVAGWILLRKNRVELKKENVAIDKEVKDAVIEQWKELLTKSEKISHKLLEECETRCEEQYNALNVKIINLEAAQAQLLKEISIRRTEGVVLGQEVKTLTGTVGELKKPDVIALAEALVEPLAEALKPIPEKTADKVVERIEKKP